MTDYVAGTMINQTTLFTSSSLYAGNINAGNIAAGNVSVTGTLPPPVGIYANAANSLALATNGAAQVIVDANGNVGIATGTPTAPLTVQSSAVIAAGSPAILIQGQSNTERIVIRSAGVAGVGTPVFSAFAARGTQAAPTAVLSGDTLGYYQVGGYDGTAYQRNAWITGIATENWSATTRGGGLVFSTTPNGSTAIAEVMRITGTGNLGIGTTAPISTLQINGTQSFADATQFNTAQSLGPRNKVINGAMAVDQRNGGAAVTMNTTSIYPVDRFNSRSGNGTWGSGVFTAQQNRNSVTPPAGFAYYMGLTVATADPLSTTTYNYEMVHWIEGYNMYDLAWGTTSAKPVTLSFWVYCSIAGTFGGSLNNGNGTRVYVFSYTLTSANTWTFVTVTIPGDVTGTWFTTGTANTGLLAVRWSLGTGSSLLGAAGSWGSVANAGVTGQTQLVSNLGANWYITGVQFEIGTVATPFERRLDQTELALCQRYYYNIVNGTAGPNNSGANYATGGHIISSVSGTVLLLHVTFPVTMRAAPTFLYTNPSGTAIGGNWPGPGSGTFGTTNTAYLGINGAMINFNAATNTMYGSGSGSPQVFGGAAVIYIFTQNATNLIAFQAEI